MLLKRVFAGPKKPALQMFAQPVENHVLRTARLQLTFDIWKAFGREIIGRGVPTNSLAHVSNGNGSQDSANNRKLRGAKR